MRKKSAIMKIHIQWEKKSNEHKTPILGRRSLISALKRKNIEKLALSEKQKEKLLKKEEKS